MIDEAFNIVREAYKSDIAFSEEIIARIDRVLRETMILTEWTYSSVAEMIGESLFREGIEDGIADSGNGGRYSDRVDMHIRHGVDVQRREQEKQQHGSTVSCDSGIEHKYGDDMAVNSGK